VYDEILWAKHQSKFLTKQRKRDRDEKSTRARLQIFDTLRGLPTRVDTLLGSYTATSDTFNDTLGSVGPAIHRAASRFEQATDKVADMLSGITEAFAHMSCKVFDIDITARIMSVISILVNVSFASAHDRLKSFLWNVFTNFGADIYRMFMSMIQVTQTHSLQMNFAIGDIMSLVGGTASTALSIPVLGSLLALLFQCLLGLPTTTNFANTIKFFGDRCRSLNNIFNFATHYSYVFEGVVDYLAETIFGIHLVKKELDAYLDGFSKWAAEVLSLSDPTDALQLRLERSEKLVYRVDYLYLKGIEYANDISIRKLDPKMTLYYQKIFKIIEDARKLCDFTGVFGNKPRMEPLVIQLHGESGVGKSGMTWPLSVDLNTLFVGDIEEARNFSNNIYFRNTEQEFWDGYHGQNIVTYDDFGQRVDSGANPNEEFMELIRAANIAPYPLHMAELGEKKRTKFNSKAIVITSNILNHNVTSLTFPDAFRRRVDICAQVVNKPDYVKTGYSITHNARVERLDTSKCNGPVDTQVYEMILFNPETMAEIPGAPRLNYEEFLSKCIDAALAKQRRSAAINTHLSTRIDSERFDKIRARLEVNYDFGAEDRLIFDDALDDAPWMLPTMAECKEAVASHLASVTRQAKQLASFRNFLLMSGVILAGLGIWKMFSTQTKTTRKMDWEANQSGDQVTSHSKKISIEGLCPCQRGTKRGCDYGCWDLDETIAKRSQAHLKENVCEHGNVRTFCFICDPTWITHHEAVTSGDENTSGARRINIEGHVKPEFWSGPCKPHGIPSGYCPVCDNACGHGNVIGHCYVCDPLKLVKLGVVKSVSPLAASLANPNCLPVVVSEATSSADALTAKGKVIRTEATLDTPLLKKDTLASLEAWRDSTAQDLISTRILSNLYRISRIRGDLPCLNGLFIRDTLMLVPKHLGLVLETTDIIRIENIFGSVFEIPISECRFITVADALGEEKDAMIIQFPRQVNAHADLVKHFQTMPELSHKSAYVTLATLRHVRAEPTLLLLGNTMAKFTSITLDTEHGKRHIRDCIEYNLNTTNGDCGSPVVCNDNSFIRKIAGIHIAAANDGSSAFGQSVTQADLLRTINRFKKVIVSDMDTMANLQLCAPVHQLNHDIEYSRSGIRMLFNGCKYVRLPWEVCEDSVCSQ
jgi:hypothetical protein